MRPHASKLTVIANVARRERKQRNVPDVAVVMIPVRQRVAHLSAAIKGHRRVVRTIVVGNRSLEEDWSAKIC